MFTPQGAKRSAIWLIG